VFGWQRRDIPPLSRPLRSKAARSRRGDSSAAQHSAAERPPPVRPARRRLTRRHCPPKSGAIRRFPNGESGSAPIVSAAAKRIQRDVQLSVSPIRLFAALIIFLQEQLGH